MATMMLPSGLITSYKGPILHGGTLKMLHTSVSKGENGEALIQERASLSFNCGSEDDRNSSSPNTWALHDARGSPHNCIKVKLINIDSEDMVEVKHIVTLEEGTLSSRACYFKFQIFVRPIDGHCY